MPRTRSGRDTTRLRSSRDTTHRTDGDTTQVTYDTQEEANYAEYIEQIRAKTVISSPIIGFEAINQLGISTEFDVMSRRVGFGPTFWEIPREYVAFPELTHDFLASVTLYEPEDDEPSIGFLLYGEYYWVYVSTMRTWFGFPEPETQYIGYGPDTGVPENLSDGRAEFWYRLTGQEPAPNSPNDFRVNHIIHPALRYMCRTLAHTIFARGESSLRPTHEDLRLLATMLRHRRDGFRRPDLMMMMVRHWVSIRGFGRSTGQITCGSYITCIASYLQIDIQRRLRITPPYTIDLGKIRQYNWITITPSEVEPIITWLTTRGHVVLPLRHSLDPFDDRTWRLDEYFSQPSQPHFQNQPTFVHVGVPPSPYAGPSQPYYQPGPTHTYFPDPEASPHAMPSGFGWPQMYTVITEIRTDQQAHTDILREVQSQTRATHQSLQEMHADHRAFSQSLQQLTSRVADLEIQSGAREDRHERRRRRRDPADPGSSRH
jgi:hypothetical protein